MTFYPVFKIIAIRPAKKSSQVEKAHLRCLHTAFQTAVALADFDNDKDEDGKVILHQRHIQQIVTMSKEFKDYLKDLHRGDEAKRADRQRIRHDDFNADG